MLRGGEGWMDEKVENESGWVGGSSAAAGWAWVGDSRAVLAHRREGGDGSHAGPGHESQPGVSATPEVLRGQSDASLLLGLDRPSHNSESHSSHRVVVRRLDQSDAFLVLGSDGLWEYVGDDEAIGVVVAAGSIEAGVKALLALAKERWLKRDGAGYVDDVTALVVGFTHRKV
ncbi:unnamed protein product [Closterium sp. Yama58-4]|nr:unnamed protein product [Closterium sp. Yama58-4]